MRAPTLNELAPDGHDFATDPHPVYAALRAKGPVHRVHIPQTGDCWLVLSRDAARAALTDPRLSNDIRHSAWDTDGGHAIGVNMLQSDPPQHTRLRRSVAAHFAPARTAALRPRIEEITADLLAELPTEGTADLVSQYALPLPVAVICEILGVPDTDRNVFHDWSTELVMPTSPEAAAGAAAALTDYLTDLTARKIATPDDTLLSELAATVPEILSSDELLGMAFLILVAGHETTVNLISATVHSLLTHPGQLAALRADLTLCGAAIEESLRYNSPVHGTALRFAAEPLVLADTPISPGDAVQISLAAASRDPAHFPAPDHFDLTRRPHSHLAFGHGLHHCLGAPLARTEATVALRLLLRHRPHLALATTPDTLTWRTSTLLRGLPELPVRLG
ncbi:cytochrome P450 [Streptomyces scabiei]|uniref:cytochrome P450 family protein n=1 Tax=Streptomyces scabiei TaxID=1930 RepID=UPI0004E68804|nr:cytochrome P450 [Streptomyces scabiei]KFG01948.1 cytochrome P450 [Streptomyces scabiei]